MRTVLLCLVVGWPLLPGCSGGLERAEISGTVKRNGELVQEGSINFLPTEGNTGPGTGAVIENGRYHISRDKGAVVGKNRVEIRAFRNTGRKVQDATGKPGVMTDERVLAFPPEYNDNSTLVRDVQSGGNTFDFDIATKDR